MFKSIVAFFLLCFSSYAHSVTGHPSCRKVVRVWEWGDKQIVVKNSETGRSELDFASNSFTSTDASLKEKKNCLDLARLAMVTNNFFCAEFDGGLYNITGNCGISTIADIEVHNGPLPPLNPQ
ncbi:MAG: hypothetical protein KBD78_11540 [Oligoflexales bacterium]|nr:hypothetical protein [Oligoflexales bacterium]